MRTYSDHLAELEFNLAEFTELRRLARYAMHHLRRSADDEARRVARRLDELLRGGD